MMTSFLFFALLLSPQQADQQLQHQQQQLDQLSRKMEEQRQQLDRMIDMLQQRSRTPLTICTVEVSHVNASAGRKIQVPLSAAAVVPFNLFSTVSRPSDGCLPAEVRVSATYFDTNENLICSGTIESIAIQDSLTQSVNLDIRPWNFREFARWRNEPPEVNSGPKRLVCVNPEGTAETTAQEMERAFSLRVRATILPVGGGMSTAEMQIHLR